MYKYKCNKLSNKKQTNHNCGTGSENFTGQASGRRNARVRVITFCTASLLHITQRPVGLLPPEREREVGTWGFGWGWFTDEGSLRESLT